MSYKEPAIEALPSAYPLRRSAKTVDIYEGVFTIEACIKEKDFDDTRFIEVITVRGTIFLEFEPETFVRLKAETFEPLKDILIADSAFRHYRVCVPEYQPSGFIGKVFVASGSGLNITYSESAFSPRAPQK